MQSKWGHNAVLKSYFQISSSYVWPKMCLDVIAYVKRCLWCHELEIIYCEAKTIVNFADSECPKCQDSRRSIWTHVSTWQKHK